MKVEHGLMRDISQQLALGCLHGRRRARFSNRLWLRRFVVNYGEMVVGQRLPGHDAASMASTGLGASMPSKPFVQRQTSSISLAAVPPGSHSWAVMPSLEL